jgi:hypothetical protein
MASAASLSGHKKPELKVISVEAGQMFISDTLEFCIEKYPDLVETFYKGILPIEMLELPLSVVKGSNIGRKAGSYSKSGIRVMVDQSASQYRDQLISETIASDIPLSKADQATALTGALAILFPESGKTTREKFRAHFDRDIRALLQMMSMSWPSMDIKTRMESDEDLEKAFKTLDLIAWIRAFNKFCLNSSGNKQLNREKAEKTLEKLKMRGLDLSAYVKDFVKAAENLKAVESLWDDRRIVTTFIKGLNQSEHVFGNIYRKFSDKHDPTFVLQSEKLSYAVSWVEDIFKEVIAPQIAERREEFAQLNSTKDVISKVNQSTKRGGSSGKSDKALVPFAVLATMVKDKRKAEEELATALKKVRASEHQVKAVEKAKTKAKAKPDPSTDSIKNEGAKDTKSSAKCYKFASQEGCSYGDKCRFSHSM